jgi:hypothetical protein
MMVSRALLMATALTLRLATPAAAQATWEFEASAFTYLVPDESNYVQPTLAADRGALHLEGRFNYENLDTGSAWVGYTFSFGERVEVELTPMGGVSVGATDGVAPGYRAFVGWRRLELYSESEYVFDAGAQEDSFLYTWSELSWYPLEIWRVGLAVQRTKAYQTEFDIQRGFLVGVSTDRFDVSTYVFNPDASRPTVVVAAALRF